MSGEVSNSQPHPRVPTRLRRKSGPSSPGQLLGNLRTTMADPFSVTNLACLAWHDFRRSWGALVIYEVLFKLLEAWLFIPAVALLLSVVLSQAGHVAVSNWDIIDFVFTPVGMLYAALLSSLAVALLLLEQAGILI